MKRLALGIICCSAIVAACLVSARGEHTALQQVATPQKIQQLRAEGPAALDRLLAEREQLLRKRTEAAGHEKTIAALDAELARLNRVIDQVGGQVHCTASGLYWYTDLEQAKAAAMESGRPILSLRMLGNLTDEYSCANSRFFRTTLYANEKISNQLRESFVLHWKSVRPVPVVTIDFGDGRKLKRTLTGNSAHHALLADGTPVDVLPGLYGPGAFLNWLKRVEQLTGELRQSPPAARADVLTQYHTERESVILERWRRELNEIAPPASSATQQVADPKAAKAPTAEEAGAMAFTKGRVELPVLASIAPTSLTPAELESAMSEETWRQLARKYYAYAALDDASVALVAQQNPAAEEAMPVAVTKTVVESPLLRLVRNLQTSIALDTVRNEYLLHRQIHHWFAEEGLPKDVDALNERVYADLFLTPSSDPWLGLAPRDVYTALPENGIVETASTGTQ